MKNRKNGGLGGFLSGRGFYAALALCLLGAVTAAWVTVDRTISSINESSNVPKPENRVISEESYSPEDSAFAAEDTAKPKEDVKIEEDPEPEEESTAGIFKKKTEFISPMKGEISKNHSGGELVKYEALNEWRTHDGIDIASPVGTEVFACGEGKILSVKNDPLWGTIVEISHPGNIISIYCGLAPELSVKPGDEVEAGSLIGTLGETNLAEADMESHLHFAMKENGKYIDPETKIK